MRKFLLLALIALWPALASAQDGTYLHELQQRARELRLAEHPYWHRLLHYRADRFGRGVTSTVDAAVFFAAPEGKRNPQAELDATLASYFDAALRFDEPGQCRTKARYEWLRAKLGFDAARLPPQECPFFQSFYDALNPAAIWLVFAASDLNSPATMYGHTLLRVDTHGQSDDQRLLAHAVNYAAGVTTGNAFSYTLQGLSGGFVGEYSIYRYYERVRQYVRINNRDLWEYPLTLTPDEMQRVIWHLWELRGAGSDYYFFSENCSYMLLSLLEVAREDLALSVEFDNLIPYTIPVDTIRVLRDAGLVGAPGFRPSMARSMAHKFTQLPPPALDWVLAYGRGRATLEDARLTAQPAQMQARMLESANDYLNYRFEAGSAVRTRALPASRAALVARSRLEVSADFSPVPQTLTPPDRGHESSRLSAGLRADERHSSLALRVRGAYHDRLDPPAGYLPGGEIEFFDIGLLAGEKVQLSDLRVVSVQSVMPWDRAFRPVLWQASGGLRRYGTDLYAARHQTELGAYVDGGVGLATGNAERWLLYGFAFGSFDANRDLDRGQGFSAGLRAGLALTWSPAFLQQFETDLLDDIGGGAQPLRRYSLGTHWQVRPQHGVRLLLNALDDGRGAQHSGELRWQLYF